MNILEKLLHDSIEMEIYDLDNKYAEKISKHDLMRLVKKLNYRMHYWKDEYEKLKKSLPTK